MMEDDDSSVRVAVRIRPKIAREVIEMCRVCTQVTPGEPQVILGTDKAFTYDFVFDKDVLQETVYDTCVATLITGALEGYNATVLAYGQTGSGKTYTMGSGFDVISSAEQEGIIPRAIRHLFSGIEDRVNKAKENGEIPPTFTVMAQFLELYNEEIIDLFNPKCDKDPYKIHEDKCGSIQIKGVSSQPIKNIEEAMHCLRLGALSRTTASTQMNTESSRSHAIFTLHIKQKRLVSVDIDNVDAEIDTNGVQSEFETLSAKFHFVDLAGSERLKRTGATGERAKEGISINCGLLALGNVISALGDKSKKALHVPYRDSKLTRLLQDSLGGNSQTVMIACISPSDRDFMETLNTLKYANRARNIKNRITVNQDKSSRTIVILRQQIAQLQMELLEYKQGKRVVSQDGTESVNDMFYENNMLQSELHNLRTRVKAMQETIDALSIKNTALLAEKATAGWISSGKNDVTEIVQSYLREIEDLRAQLMESNYLCEQLRKTVTKNQDIMTKSLISPTLISDISSGDTSNIIQEAKRELQKEKEILEKNKTSEDAEGENYESSEKDSDTETETDSEEKVDDGLRQEIDNLSTNIDLKQKLISQLELSQQRLQVMRQHYEEKLLLLQNRIKDTQDERDKVLQSFSGHQTEPTEKVIRIKNDYEKKISELQKEMKRLQEAKKEHARLLKSQTQNQNQLRTLRNDLAEMKRAKVKLLTKMKEESMRHREAETRRVREIEQLRKESRRNANVIRTMEAERRVKDQVLRRKQQEVSALRKEKQGRLSIKASGRVPAGHKYSPKAAKQRWLSLEKQINKVAITKHGLVSQELQMEKLLEKRDILGKDLEKYKQRRKVYLANKQDVTEIDSLIEDLKENIRYIQETITETQQSVMEIEEEANENHDIALDIKDLNEAKYLIQKLCTMTINQSYAVAQAEAKLQETEQNLNEVKQEMNVRSQLLDHMLHTDQDIFSKGMVSSISSNANESETEAASSTSSRSTSPTENEKPIQQTNKTKIRRRTALPQELLFGKDDRPTESLQEEDHGITRVPSAPGSLKNLTIVRTHSTVEVPTHKAAERKATVPPSPRATHRIPLHHSTKHGSM